MRNYKLDNAKFLLIILVVFGHFLESGLYQGETGIIRDIYWIIYCFHMPAFIFIAGYFSKKMSWRDTFVKNFFSFLLPYIVFQVLYVYSYHYFFGNELIFNILYPKWILWFLVSMIFWNFCLQLVIRFPKLVYVFLLLSFAHRFFIEDLFLLSIGRTLSFLPFFFLGYYIKAKGLSVNFDSIRYKIIGMCGMMTIFILYKTEIVVIPSNWFYGTSSFKNQWSLLLFSEQFLVLLISATMTLFFLMCAPVKKTLFSKMGAATLSVYLFHAFIRNWLLSENLSIHPVDLKDAIQLFIYSLLIVCVLSSYPFRKVLDIFTVPLCIINKKKKAEK